MSPIRPSRTLQEQLGHLQEDARACTRCVSDGFITEAAPIFEGSSRARFLLVGQAPGPVERETGRPFSGRAGAELWRWMARAGFESEAEFRRLTYIAAVMRCFPGRNPRGGGDRRPSPPEMANCSGWLDAELRLLRPAVVLAVGQLAIARFLGPGTLETRVGAAFGSGPTVVPLPHPSGQSRWLNALENRERLNQALRVVSELRLRCITTPS